MAHRTSPAQLPLLHRTKRQARRWISRVRNKIAAQRFDYPGWLAAHIAARQPRLQTLASPGQFSFLTGVYEKTPPQLFSETAAAVFAQTASEFEWVLLAHGPIPVPLRNIIDDVSADRRIRLINLRDNRGIIGGMRVCLEAATGQYVIPLDADDLLFPDALQVFAQAIVDHDTPTFLYSDEDHYTDGRPCAPFQRPDWDPVLNLASSYIWHLCAFDRMAALDLGVYNDLGSNYCHDWDTVFRFARRGYLPQHVAEIVYHWRTHAASHTNRRQPHPGSVESQRHVLETHIAAQPHPELYEVGPFPLDRGAQEWTIRRKRLSPPTVDLLYCGDLISHSPRDGAFPFHHRLQVAPTTPQILDACRNTQAEFVVVCAEEIQPPDDAGIWEAIGLFELHPDVSLISGRLVDSGGMVIAGGEVRHDSRQYTCPDAGGDELTPGPFALWLKPRCVDAVDPRFFLARTDFVKQAADHVRNSPVEELGRRLGALAQSQGNRVATSPLTTAIVSRS